MNENIYVVDFSDVKEKEDIHRVLAKAFELPDYYGKNWDALWDCLTDIAEKIVRIDVYGFDVLEKGFPMAALKLKEVLTDFENHSGTEIVFAALES